MKSFRNNGSSKEKQLTLKGGNVYAFETLVFYFVIFDINICCSFWTGAKGV
jgi:hypothetical protein